MVAVARKRVDLRLPEELVEAVDAARGDVTRTRWVERALEAALRSNARSVGPDSQDDVPRPETAGPSAPPRASRMAEPDEQWPPPEPVD